MIKVTNIHKIISWTIFINYFVITHMLFSYVYRLCFEETPSYFDVQNKFNGPIFVFFVFLLNVFYVYCYTSKFGKKYKANELEWPWVDNPAHWKANIKDLLLTYVSAK